MTPQAATRRHHERRGERGLVAPVATALVLAWAVLAAPSRVLALDLPLVNVAPVAFNDAYSARTGVSLTVSAPGVLKNDVDVDLDTLHASLVDGGGSGSLDLNADGGFTFTSGGSFVGDRTFTYRAWDGAAFSNVATVTIHVGPAATPAPTPVPTPTPRPTATPIPLPTPPLPTLPLPTLGPLPTIIVLPTPTGTPPPTTTPPPTPTPTADPSRSASPSSAPPGSSEPGVVGPGLGGGPGSPGDAGSGGSAGGGEGRAPFDVGRLDGPPVDELDLGGTGVIGLDTVVEWAVPSLVLGVPGIVLILVVGAHVLGGLFWVPVVRRWLGGLGVRLREPAAR